jgi:hypothetical protein
MTEYRKSQKADCRAFREPNPPIGQRGEAKQHTDRPGVARE